MYVTKCHKATDSEFSEDYNTQKGQRTCVYRHDATLNADTVVFKNVDYTNKLAPLAIII